jgi:catechol 2,3-dioxygenase-like lactoylglutathione lyase family enzyme
MPVSSEIRIVTVGVADLDRSSRFYREVLGWQARDRGDVDRRLHAAWRIPGGVHARYEVLSRPGSASSMLRLVAFDRPGERIWGDYSRVQDHGHFALNFRVPDCRAAWPKLQAAGAVPRSEPTRWSIDEGLVAWDSQAFDPDGVLLDVYEVESVAGRHARLYPPLGGEVANDLETVAIHVASADRSRDFYAALGFEVYFDRTIEQMSEFLHLPPGVALRDVNMVMQDRPHVGCIEIVEYVGLPGQSLRDRATPPNLGILSITFDAADLAEVEYVTRKHGATPITSQHVVANLPPWGEAAMYACYGPDGEVLEFCRAPEATE